MSQRTINTLSLVVSAGKSVGSRMPRKGLCRLWGGHLDRFCHCLTFTKLSRPTHLSEQPERDSYMSETPKNTGQFGAGNPGKPKGAVNKTTLAAKEAIAIAADRLGGAERLVEWVKEDPLNERTFWGSIYPKLLPLQVSGENGGPIGVTLVVSGVQTSQG